AHIECGAHHVKGRLQLMSQAERLGARYRLIKALELFERLVGALNRVFDAAVCITSEHHLWAEQRREGCEVFLHLAAHKIRYRTSQFAQREKSLSRVLRIHHQEISP